MRRSVIMISVFREGSPVMVTVNGVIIKVTEKSVSCLSGIKLTTSLDLETYSDQSGEFSITEVVTNRERGLTILFDDENKEYAFDPIAISNIIQEAKEVNINVIIQPLPMTLLA
jgi:hypothetical protein